MNNLFVNCNHCGEQLQIEDEIMFTTCRSCQSPLEIVRTFNSVYTKAKKVEREELIENREELHEELPKLSSMPITIPNEIDKNDIYKQIELLDRSWERRLAIFMINGKLPDRYHPISILYCIPTYLIYEGIAYQISGFIYAGLLFGILLSLYVFKPNPNKKAYKKAKRNYEQQRENLLNQLNQ